MTFFAIFIKIQRISSAISTLHHPNYFIKYWSDHKEQGDTYLVSTTQVAQELSLCFLNKIAIILPAHAFNDIYFAGLVMMF